MTTTYPDSHMFSEGLHPHNCLRLDMAAGPGIDPVPIFGLQMTR